MSLLSIAVMREDGGWHRIDKDVYDANPDAFTLADDGGKPLPTPASGDNGSGYGQVSETPDGTPTPIPADWRDMHHTKIIALAKELAGDFEATADKTMTQIAKDIIGAAEDDRAAQAAKS